MVEGGGYGALKNGRWTGMIADLRSQKADMAVIDMSITSIRQTAVDFTMPYMTTGDLLRWGKLIFYLPLPRRGNFIQEKVSASTQSFLLPAASLYRSVDLHDGCLPRGVHLHVPPGQDHSLRVGGQRGGRGHQPVDHLQCSLVWYRVLPLSGL